MTIFSVDFILVAVIELIVIIVIPQEHHEGRRNENG